jgi:hypothetical protein
MKTYGGVKVEPQLFLISAVNGGDSHRCGPGFETGSIMWDFVVDKVALG